MIRSSRPSTSRRRIDNLYLINANFYGVSTFVTHIKNWIVIEDPYKSLIIRFHSRDFDPHVFRSSGAALLEEGDFHVLADIFEWRESL